jgi:hypothetical protein
MGRAVPVIAPSQLSFVFPLVTFVTLLWGSEFVVRQHHQLIFSGQTLSFVRAVTFFRYQYGCRLAFVLGKRINGDSGVIIVNNHILSLNQCYHLLFLNYDLTWLMKTGLYNTENYRRTANVKSLYIILLIFLWQLSVHRCWFFQVVGGCCTVVHTMPSYAPLPV